MTTELENLNDRFPTKHHDDRTSFEEFEQCEDQSNCFLDGS